jgi:hypothetical protein
MAFSIRSSLASATRGGLVKPGAPSSIAATWNTVAAATATATVTFTAGTPPGLNYTVSATPSGGTATLPIAAVTTGTAISSLANNKSHTFTVVAKRGTLTNSTTSSSYLSPPGPVTIGTISSITNAGASVAYTAPTGDGTYAITTTPASSSTAPTSNPMAINGLTGNTNYTFTIKVSNDTANNSSTSSSYLTIPDQPSIGTVAITSATVVSVPFTLATGNTGTGKGTISSVTIVSNPSIALTYTNTSSTPVSVTGTFASGTSYKFTISVTNATGTSAVSAESTGIIPNPVANVYNPPTYTEPSGITAPVIHYVMNSSYLSGTTLKNQINSSYDLTLGSASMMSVVDNYGCLDFLNTYIATVSTTTAVAIGAPSNYTVTTWVYWRSTAGNYSDIWELVPSNNSRYELEVQGDGGNLNIWSEETGAYFSVGSKLNNAWKFYVVVFGTGGVKTYSGNGVSGGSNSNSCTAINRDKIRLGQSNYNNGKLNGCQTDFRIYDYALSVSQVQSLYAAGPRLI